jgi:hypothetical protein
VTALLKFSKAGRKARRLALSGMAIAALALSIYPAAASAGGFNEYKGRNLPGHSWTTGNGVVIPEFVIGGGANTTSSVCVGPVTHDAGGYHTPYGWDCSTTRLEYFFPEITAAAGIYNPNAGTFGEFSVTAI